jgi:tetratricopeptide (TPR) repeat protein
MKALISSLLFLFLMTDLAAAQTDQYQQANRLMQQQNYEEALPILENLYDGNPRSYVFFDLYTECLINLKRFDEAEQIARNQMDQNRFNLQATMRLAEILHLSGDREQAREVWASKAEINRGNIQAYYTIGSSMLDRQEYDAAIDLYNKAQEYIGDDTLFLNELANTYMQAGRFEESVQQYFRLIINSPDQMSLVQQRFLRMRDQNLYQIAAFELEDQLMELDFSHRAYSPLYQLLTWLLMETEEYQRAFVFARLYENQTSYTIHALFTLANQLLSARQFELAVQSLEYYLDSSEESVLYRAKEELGVAYTQWVQYLQQNNLEDETRYRELYSKAYEMNEIVLENVPDYERADRVYSRIIDLSVDFFKDIEKATFWLERMQQYAAQQNEAYLYYAEGRIALFNKDFTTARQTLTRADRATDNSNLSERARYYLSLSDFYAGEYEFAEIQLRSLERRHTSYYANDAIKMRMWIKNGKRADTTGAVLQTISESLYNIHTGNYNAALENLEPILANSQNQFADDLVVELGSSLPAEYDGLVFKLTERVLRSQPYSPLKERMLWDKASMIEKYLFREIDFPTPPWSYDFLGEADAYSYSQEDLYELYEDILMEFPDGFYAPFIRQKLQELELTSI